MDLTLQTESLVKALATVSKAIATRPTLPVLSHVLLDANVELDTFRVAGTDLELWIDSECLATIKEPGSLTVPFRLLDDLAKELPSNQAVNLSMKDVDTLHVQCGNLDADIRGIDAQEFPMQPGGWTENYLATFDPGDLSNWLSRVAYAAAGDESRPILTGVYIENKDGNLAFVTADGFRLAVQKVEAEEAPGSFVLPARAAKEVARLLKAETERVSLFMDDKRSKVWFRMSRTNVVSQLLEGHFVNYRQIIPSSHSTRIVVDRVELTKALQTAILFNRDTKLAQLSITEISGYAEGALRVQASGTEAGEFETEMHIELEGEPIDAISFNSGYVLDSLSACGTDKVVIELTGSTRPGVIKPVGDDGYLCVIMPMHLRS